jgi:hypothetical protein
MPIEVGRNADCPTAIDNAAQLSDHANLGRRSRPPPFDPSGTGPRAGSTPCIDVVRGRHVIGETLSRFSHAKRSRPPECGGPRAYGPGGSLVRAIFTRSSESGSAGGVSVITSAVLVLHHTDG